MKKSTELSFAEAFQKAASFCAYQERCKAEVRQKLNKFVLQDDFTESIISKLEEENYLNEERFCKEFVRGKLYGKSWGKIKIKAALQQKQVSQYLISTVLEEIDEEEYHRILLQVIEKKRKSLEPIDSPAKKSKLIHFAVSRGFEYGIILDNIKDDYNVY
ncbi:regulatory protein RecX [Flexithrix dorotheae]|uniref:regulatory protein RecX n=1 Tax=Flexithrix dorotheae TaxID=70993 RepID=UPI000381A24D|nr:regulatory protein RecX [Flexithrix dorotheae]